MKKWIGSILGAILIASGVSYILGAFGIADIQFSFDGWWALFVILPAIQGLITSREKLQNLFCLLLGVYLLLAARGVIDYAIGVTLFVPILIILLGIKMIVKSTSAKEREELDTMEADDTGEESTVAKIGAVFGGASCNLTDTKIKDGSRLDVLCIFGGADIIVPENVKVKINAFCLFGGISDERTVMASPQEGATLIVNGFCLFGGADIKTMEAEE